MKFQVYGATSPEESNREREHRKLAREAAAEGIVLLKNDGVLPIHPGKIALYGPGSRMTVKGGSGSGDVRDVAAGVGIDVADVAFWRESLGFFEEKLRELERLAQ